MSYDANAPEPATLLLHKPVGFDAVAGARPASALATADAHWDEDPSGIAVEDRHFVRLTPLVPLDTDASGLMVVTQDGRAWRRLTEDADSIEHEYIVDTAGDIAPYGLHALNSATCKVSWQNEFRLRFAIKGAKPGQLRAMCEQVGLQAVAIRRIRIGKVSMGKMPAGQWRYLPVGGKF